MKALAAMALAIPLCANAFTAQYDAGSYIVAIGSYAIDGKLYDISFTGAFGVTDAASIGLDPYKAGKALADIVNFDLYLDQRNRYRQPFPMYATDAHTRVQVQIDDNFAWETEYLAGWPCCGKVALEVGNLAYFRLAIPGSLPDTTALGVVPEPATYALAFAGLMVVGAVARQRRR